MEYAPVRSQDEGASRGATCFHYHSSPIGGYSGEGNNLGCALTGGPGSLTVAPKPANPCESDCPWRDTGVDFAVWLPALHRPAGRWTTKRVLVSGWSLDMGWLYSPSIGCQGDPVDPDSGRIIHRIL